MVGSPVPYRNIIYSAGNVIVVNPSVANSFTGLCDSSGQGNGMFWSCIMLQTASLTLSVCTWCGTGMNNVITFC